MTSAVVSRWTRRTVAVGALALAAWQVAVLVGGRAAVATVYLLLGLFHKQSGS
ncbi:hypothetical protein [Halomicrococcus gelatinilyticus]|uniref:hypothetical protein n=1 Tax=Halomicrococcus gelatinilyticus TaxID=1702103 RepID=UPI002E15E2D2